MKYKKKKERERERGKRDERTKIKVHNAMEHSQETHMLTHRAMMQNFCYTSEQATVNSLKKAEHAKQRKL